ncbi:MAG: sulfatase-like hydrolase/transferase [Verrucomicrobia bacterium]|nr:sulfatase-like hydrolase/transferase [Verrucomicrobiota bacterium]
MNDTFQSDARATASGTGGGEKPSGVRGLPTAAWCRLWELFCGLVLIKVVMLFGLQKHLFETHWRVMGVKDSWLDYVAFYGFGFVGVLSVVGVGQWCGAVGVKAVRWANATIVLLGLLFIFLTFHEGPRNYVSRIMEGNLEWKGLIPYLSMNFFFKKPFLAVWLAVYGIVYFVLVRRRRENLALYLTAVMAGFYWLVCFQEFVHRRRELLVCVMIGLASLSVLWNRERPMRARWLLWPLLWTGMIWVLFAGEVDILVKLTPYFALLLGEIAVLFVALTLLAKRCGFVQPWLRVVMFYFVGFILLACGHFPMAENYKSLLGFAVSCPHYFIGEFGLTCAIWVVAAFVRRFRQVGSWWWLDVVVIGLILLALVDLRVTQIMGVRVGCDLIAFADSPKMMLRMAKPYLPSLFVVMLAVLAIYFAGLRMARWWLGRQRADSSGMCASAGGRFVLAAFVLLGLVGIGIALPDVGEGHVVFRLVQTSSIWKRAVSRPMSSEEFASRARALGMDELVGGHSPETSIARRDLNVVLVFMESSYNKHLSLFGGTNETQPLLSQYRDRMELFPNFFSSFASSIHARFATFTGLYPVSDFSSFTIERVGVKSIFEVMNENGYSCSLFYSSFFDYTGFRQFLKQRGLSEMWDADTMPGVRKTSPVAWGLREEETLEAMRSRIRTYSTNREKFFMTYIPAAPHYPYDSIPERFQKYKATEVGNYEPMYLNELLYMDWIVSSILDELKQTGLLERTLVVITADHGEMLGSKDGAVGHGWKVTPELANVPLIVMDPERPGFRLNASIGSQVDLLPTIIDRLGIQMPSELYQGATLYGVGSGTNKTIYLNSYQDYAMIRERRFYCGNRRVVNDGEQSFEVYDVNMDEQGHARYISVSESSGMMPSIQDFDEFQMRFLKNYGIYKDKAKHP